MRLGVVAAVKPELRATLRALHPKSRRIAGKTYYEAGPLVFAVGGVGAAKAEKAARALVQHFQPTDLVSTGFGGALRGGLGTGDLVVGGSSGFLPSEDLLGRARRVGPAARVAETVTADGVLVGRSEKDALSGRTAAVAVDMESAAVGKVARERGLGFLCVKAILDTPEEPLASRYESVGKVLGEILRRPATLARIFSDAARARAASERLSAFFTALAAELERASLP